MSLKDKASNRRLVLLSLVFLLTLIILGLYFHFKLQFIVETLVTLVAVGLGAYLAYDLSVRRQEKTNTESHIQSANLALFTLIELFNSLKNYQITVIDPHRSSNLRFIAIPPELIHQEFAPRLKVNSLGFLLSDTGNVNLLGKMVVEERQYHAIAHNIQKRSTMHTEIVQPALENAALIEMEAVDVDQFREALGERIHAIMERTTGHIIQAVDQSIANFPELISDLHHSCSKIFPGKGFLKLMDESNSN